MMYRGQRIKIYKYGNKRYKSIIYWDDEKLEPGKMERGKYYKSRVEAIFASKRYVDDGLIPINEKY